MKYPEMLDGTLLQRLNRFAVLVRTPSGDVTAFLPNSGRLKELLVPGAKTKLIPVDNPNRKTKFDFALVQYEGNWVSVNSHLANDLFHEAILEKRLEEFKAMDFVRREVTIGKSRLDFLLNQKKKDVFIEVKSVTLVVSERARFPDAPTTRGTKHLNELISIAQQGIGAGVVFVIQRSDATSFSPNRNTDPDFANALLAASNNGVKLYAYRSFVGPDSIFIKERVPVILDEL